MIHYLIDTSWLLYRGYYSSAKIWEDNPELHFLTKKLDSLLQRSDAIVHLAIDGYNTKGRRLLGENYKAGRHEEGSYNVYNGLASFLKLLNNDRIKVYYNKNLESDEIIFTLSRTLDGRKKIISGDKDIFQALAPNVIIDNGGDLAITDESYKLEYADKFFGIDPIRLPIYRAIVGDSSDTLKPPVPRFPHKLAAKIAKDVAYAGHTPTIDDIKAISKAYKDSEKKWLDKLFEAHSAFAINFDIMKLNVVTDSLNEPYDYKEIELTTFLKSKILKLNSL